MPCRIILAVMALLVVVSVSCHFRSSCCHKAPHFRKRLSSVVAATLGPLRTVRPAGLPKITKSKTATVYLPLEGASNSALSVREEVINQSCARFAYAWTSLPCDPTYLSYALSGASIRESVLHAC